METFLGMIEATGLAQYLRVSRWGYAAVNAAHILGVALLVGAIVPLDLRLLGAWRGTPRTALVRVLVPVAAAGLILAVAAGLLLFSVRAREYAGLGVVQLKLTLVLVGIVAALSLHLSRGWRLEGAGRLRLACHAALSMTCWLGALVCGRLIAFAAD